MKANELRIGNYIYPFDDIYLVDSKTIFKDCVSVTYKDFKNTNHLQPIPLTEEWLLKFGAKHIYLKNKDGEILQDKYEINIDFFSKISIESDFSFGLYSNDSDDLVIFENDIIKSVHQLQNLYFALTNEELTIKQ